MNSDARWIELAGADNVRDLGGLPVAGGTTTRFGRILRADNLQDLTAADISYLVDTLGLTDVVDLRSSAEITMEGPGPLTRVPGVTIHHFPMLAEPEQETGVDAEAVLPWVSDGEKQEERPWLPPGEFYLHMLKQRPVSVMSALRVMAGSRGAALAHCAAGKDRTGILTALMLTVVGVPQDAIVEDYALSSVYIDRILDRLIKTPTYADDTMSRPRSSHVPRPENMQQFLQQADQHFGGLMNWLDGHGWTTADSDAMRARLLV